MKRLLSDATVAILEDWKARLALQKFQTGTT
jgi:hypothetical protein